MSDSFVTEPVSVGWLPFQIGPIDCGSLEVTERTFPTNPAGNQFPYTFILTDVDFGIATPATEGFLYVFHQPIGVCFYTFQSFNFLEGGEYHSWAGAHIFQSGDVIEIQNETTNSAGFTGFGWVNVGGALFL